MVFRRVSGNALVKRQRFVDITSFQSCQVLTIHSAGSGKTTLMYVLK